MHAPAMHRMGGGGCSATTAESTMVDVNKATCMGSGKDGCLGCWHPARGGASGVVEGAISVEMQQGCEFGVGCWLHELGVEGCHNNCAYGYGGVLDCRLSKCICA